MTESRPPLEPAQLRRSDPPQLGEVEIVGRLGASDAGYVYAGWAGQTQVAVVVLSEGADGDSYGRTRFLRAIESELAADSARIVAFEADEDVAPWAALAVASWSEAADLGRGLLAPVTLDDVPNDRQAAGPSYRPHWYERVGVGRWRLWPLPWPQALTTAGRWTFLASFAVILLIAASALFIASRIFDNTPNPLPPPVQPLTPSPPTTTPPSPTPTPSGPSPTRPTNGNPSSVPPIV